MRQRSLAQRNGLSELSKLGLLILDEATSDLDPGIKGSLFMISRNLSESLTIFAISHWSSFSQVADIISVVEEGELHPWKKRP